MKISRRSIQSADCTLKRIQNFHTRFMCLYNIYLKFIEKASSSVLHLFARNYVTWPTNYARCFMSCKWDRFLALCFHGTDALLWNTIQQRLKVVSDQGSELWTIEEPCARFASPIHIAFHLQRGPGFKHAQNPLWQSGFQSPVKGSFAVTWHEAPLPRATSQMISALRQAFCHISHGFLEQF
jgi:hypothetical protein